MWGWFHLIWLGLFVLCVIAAVRKKSHSEKELKTVLLIYGIGSLILELTKQIIWTVEVDPATMTAVWDYQWYAAPFQLCTMPLYISLIAAALKPCGFRNALLSFLAFFTIVASIAVAFYPNTVFCTYVEVNIHTMYLHIGALALSCYLLISGQVKPTKKSVIHGFFVFLVVTLMALILDIVVYQTGLCQDESFNMFYISPYFPCSLPVLDQIWAYFIDRCYPAFLVLYLFALTAGGAIIFGIVSLVYARRDRARRLRQVSEAQKAEEKQPALAQKSTTDNVR